MGELESLCHSEHTGNTVLVCSDHSHAHGKHKVLCGHKLRLGLDSSPCSCYLDVSLCLAIYRFGIDLLLLMLTFYIGPLHFGHQLYRLWIIATSKHMAILVEPRFLHKQILDSIPIARRLDRSTSNVSRKLGKGDFRISDFLPKRKLDMETTRGLMRSALSGGTGCTCSILLS